jgi:hypothetical protein
MRTVARAEVAAPAVTPTVTVMAAAKEGQAW